MKRSPSSILSTVSIVCICRSQLGRLPHFLIVLGSSSSGLGCAFSEDAGEGDAFRLMPLLFLPLFLDLVSSSPSSSALSALAFWRNLPRFLVAVEIGSEDVSTEGATGGRGEAFGLGSDLRPAFSLFFLPWRSQYSAMSSFAPLE